MSEQSTPPPRPAPPARAAAGPTRPEEGAAERALQRALGRLDELDALQVHEHAAVYAEVDDALRERLAGTEG
ncbi:hypothetical protein [Kineococcus gypseus]|uniref:hypothetical protein n=1 Tax=Kineococcus gypseus TaxID=1637102 RepID=UPI003D7C62FD